MIRLLVLLSAEVGAAVGVHRLAAPRVAPLLAEPAALASAGTGELLLALVHAGAWLGCWWVLLGTAHDVVAVARGAGARGRRAGRRVAPRWIRRVVEQAVGTALLVGVAAGPAAASIATPAAASIATPAPVVVAPPVPVVPGGGAGSDGGTGSDSGSGSDGGAGSDGAAAPRGPADGVQAAGPSAGGSPAAGGGDTGPAAPATTGTHRVAAGENLWVIARQHLAEARGGATPTDREVHAHWVALIAANRDGLRSGDPDLVFPGEVLALPAPPPAPDQAPADPGAGEPAP